MNHKIYLKVVRGRWYISLGTKGYKSTFELDKALSEWVTKDSATITFTSEKTPDSVRRVVIRYEDGKPIMDFYDPNSNELLKSVKQCPKIFVDYVIDKEFYINYNPEW